MSVEPPLMRDVLNGVLNSRIDASGLYSSFPATQLTTAELAAGSGGAPINLAYPPGYVQRGGSTLGDNTTDDTAAWQRTLDGLPLGGEMIIPDFGGTYLIAGNLTVTGRKSIRTIGYPKIRHTGNGHLFELTGSSGSANQYIGDMEIQGTSSGLSGIYANGANNGPHEFRNLYIHDYSTGACIRMDNAYSYQIGLCWLRDSAFGVLGENGAGVNEVYLQRNHFTNCGVAVQATRGNHWRGVTNFFTGGSTAALGYRMGYNNTTGEPFTDFETIADEFEGSYDIAIEVGQGSSNLCRGIAIIRPELDVVDANLGAHCIRVQNTIGFELKVLGRFPNLTGTKKWYSIEATVDKALINDIAYNSAQSTILATNYRLITQDRIDGSSQEIENPILAQRLIMNGNQSPAQITANQNNYNPPGFSICNILRLNSDAARDITGLVPSANNQTLLVLNSGGFPITLKHESASSTAANRFTFAAGNDLILNRTGMLWLHYDQTNARWFGSLAT